jgi:Transposase DDE domain
VSLGEKNKLPTVLIADSQAVKNSGSAHEKGFCVYKCINGIKRHLVTDVLGCPPMIEITTANVSDDQGLVQLITTYIEFFKQKPVNIKKITFLVDNGYHPLKIYESLIKIYPGIKTKLKIKVTPKPVKDNENPGFKPVHKRWIVEQANSFIDKCRCLWKNCERYLETSKCKVQYHPLNYSNDQLL